MLYVIMDLGYNPETGGRTVLIRDRDHFGVHDQYGNGFRQVTVRNLITGVWNQGRRPEMFTADVPWELARFSDEIDLQLSVSENRTRPLSLLPRLGCCRVTIAPPTYTAFITYDRPRAMPPSVYNVVTDDTQLNNRQWLSFFGRNAPDWCTALPETEQTFAQWIIEEAYSSEELNHAPIHHQRRECAVCHARYTTGDNLLCNRCIEDNAYRGPVAIESASASPRTCHLLFDYNYAPPVFNRKRLLSDSGSQVPYLGVELEMRNTRFDATAGRRELPSGFWTLMPHEAATYLSDDFIYCVRDGSVRTGLEAVSHPFTYNWLLSNEAVFDKVLSMKDFDYRSYQTDCCGMHVHISKDSFSHLHMYKFMKMIYEEPGLILEISQRRLSALNRWCRLDENFNNSDPNQIVYRAKAKDNGGLDKYTACRVTEHTLELRIFRGNLNRMSFFKNIEFTQALFEYTKECAITEVNRFGFLNWIAQKQKRFSNLYGWLDKRGMFGNRPQVNEEV